MSAWLLVIFMALILIFIHSVYLTIKKNRTERYHRLRPVDKQGINAIKAIRGEK